MDQNLIAPREFKAFISYRHLPLDMAIAKAVQERIESYVIPRDYRGTSGAKRFGRVFRDEDELPLSRDLNDDIIEALDHSEYLIVVCTPDLPESLYCDTEIRHFLETHDRDNVIAVLAQGTPQESFSPLLLHEYDEAGAIACDIEPLAANLTDNSHNYDRKRIKKEIVRIYAKMLGCAFDELWQRERRRAANRIAFALSIALVIMAIFVGTVLHYSAEISASEQRHRNTLMESLTQEGSRLYVEGETQAALAYFVKVLSEDPSNAAAKTGALIALQQQGWLYPIEGLTSEEQVAETQATPPSSLSAFGELTQEPDDKQQAYVFYGSNTIRVWLPDSGQTYEIDRISYNPSYEDPPYIMTLKHEGYFYLIGSSEDSIYVYKAPASKKSSDVIRCRLAHTLSIEAIFDEQDPYGYDDLELATNQLWASPETGLVGVGVFYGAIVLDVVSGEVVELHIADHGDDAIWPTDILFSSDGRRYAVIDTYDFDGALMSYRVSCVESDGREVGRSPEKGQYYYRQAAFHPDGSLLALVDTGSIQLISARTCAYATAPILQESMSRVQFAQDGSIRVSDDDGTETAYDAVWLTYTGTTAGTSSTSSNTAADLRIVPNSTDGTLQLIDDAGEVLDTLAIDMGLNFANPQVGASPSGSVGYCWTSAIDWADRNYFYRVGIDGKRLAEPERIQIPVSYGSSILTLASFEDGCAVCLLDGTILVYHDGQASPVQSMRAQHTNLPDYYLTASSDGFLAVCTTAGPPVHMELWNMTTGMHIANPYERIWGLEDWGTASFGDAGTLMWTILGETHTWLLQADDPDEEAVAFLDGLCNFTLTDDLRLEEKTPVFSGTLGNWSSIFDVEFLSER